MKTLTHFPPVGLSRRATWPATTGVFLLIDKETMGSRLGLVDWREFQQWNKIKKQLENITCHFRKHVTIIPSRWYCTIWVKYQTTGCIWMDCAEFNGVHVCSHCHQILKCGHFILFWRKQWERYIQCTIMQATCRAWLFFPNSTNVNNVKIRYYLKDHIIGQIKVD